MNSFTEDQIAIFPLESTQDVVDFFRMEMVKKDPSLALVSIVIGVVESSLTLPSCRLGHSSLVSDLKNCDCLPQSLPIPPLHFDTVYVLLVKWTATIVERVVLSEQERRGAMTVQLIKRASDAVWMSLARNYRQEQHHMHSILSLLTVGRLDCLGVAVATVAACQTIMPHHPVLLAQAEHHYWAAHTDVSCGELLHSQVTWHGSDSEDRRGSVLSCPNQGRSWQYAGMCPVLCDRHMQLCVVVAAISADTGGGGEAGELLLLQSRLLWLLHDTGHLARHPLVLATLASLQQHVRVEATPGDCHRRRPDHETLLRQAVLVSKTAHHDKLVLPYLQLGAALAARDQHAEALHAWSRVGRVLRGYDYGRGDEELYKELFCLVAEYLPHTLKASPANVLCAGASYNHVLALFDGLCCWEQRADTPVLHVRWAQAMLACLTRFEPAARRSVFITTSRSCVGREENEVDHEGVESSLAADGRCLIRLYSAKMSAISQLLAADQLKMQPISLQLSAQLQPASARDNSTENGAVAASSGPRRSKR